MTTLTVRTVERAIRGTNPNLSNQEFEIQCGKQMYHIMSSRYQHLLIDKQSVHDGLRYLKAYDTDTYGMLPILQEYMETISKGLHPL